MVENKKQDYELKYIVKQTTLTFPGAGTQFLRCDSPDGSTKSHTFRLRYNSMGGRFEVYKRNTSYHIFGKYTLRRACIFENAKFYFGVVVEGVIVSNVPP